MKDQKTIIVTKIETRGQKTQVRCRVIKHRQVKGKLLSLGDLIALSFLIKNIRNQILF